MNLVPLATRRVTKCNAKEARQENLALPATRLATSKNLTFEE